MKQEFNKKTLHERTLTSEKRNYQLRRPMSRQLRHPLITVRERQIV